MKGELFYPNIKYFELAKAMPLCPVGSIVSICDADGREALFVNDIHLPIETALKEPEWFIAVYSKKRSL